MTTGPMPVCFDCARLRRFPYCTAFGPEVEIPDEIANSMLDHREPFDGDHGRLFQQATLAEKQRINRAHGMPPPPGDYEAQRQREEEAD